MSTQTSHDANPFPGLRPFQEDEDHLFFGREKKVKELLSKLQEGHFVAVMGASGSGKSSLVRSGLVSGLQSGVMEGTSATWKVVTSTPGENPIKNLAAALHKSGVATEADFMWADDVENTLREGPKGLVDVMAKSGLPADTQMLVVIDQFEEIFRFAELEKNRSVGQREAQAFIDLILQASQQRTVPVYICLTMRSDFLEECTTFNGLPEAINTGQYLIPRMNTEELNEAITGPAKAYGAEVSSFLLDLIHNDLTEQSEQLPLLQHALMRTWDYWKSLNQPETPIGLEHYQHVGTLHLGLSYHADEIYDSLPSDQSKKVCELMFKALTEKNAEHKEGVRRPTKMADLVEITMVDFDQVAEVVEAFRAPGRNLLMPPVREKLTPETVIDISHESLMRIWQKLVRWSLEEREVAHRYGNLLTRAQMWKSPAGGSLVSNPELTDTLYWMKEQQLHKGWAARYGEDFQDVLDYLQASKEGEKTMKVAVRRGRRVRVTAVVLAFGLILAAVFAWWALRDRNEAQDAYTVAAAERDEAEAGRQEAIAETEEVRQQMAELAAQGFDVQGNEEAVVQATQRADSLGALIALLQEQIELETQRADENQELAESAQARIAELDSITEVYGVQLRRSAAEREEALAQARRLKALTDAEVLANQGYQLLRRNQVQRGKDLVMAAYDTNRVHGGPEFNAAIFQALTEAYISVSRPTIYETQFPLTEWPSASFHEDSKRLAVASALDGVRISKPNNVLKFDEPVALGEPIIGLAWSKDGKFLFAGGRKFMYRIEVAIGEVRSIRLRGMGRRGIFFMTPVDVDGVEQVLYATDEAIGIVPMLEFAVAEDAEPLFSPSRYNYIRQLQVGPAGDIWVTTDFSLIELN
ncbi:MAG: hypothetical protein AAFQ98_22420, partial [Bacteroidota bacterium]